VRRPDPGYCGKLVVARLSCGLDALQMGAQPLVLTNKTSVSWVDNRVCMRSSRRTQSRPVPLTTRRRRSCWGCHPLGERIVVRIHGLTAACRKRADGVNLPVPDMFVSRMRFTMPSLGEGLMLPETR
jgi:hypothetical protein